MRYDLRLMASRRTNRARIILRPIEPTKALARPLRNEADRTITEIRNAVSLHLLSVYEPRPVVTTDALIDVLTGALALVKDIGQRLVASIDLGVRPWAVRVEEWHRTRWARNVQAGTGVDTVAMLTASDAEEQVQAALRWASSLIKDIDEKLLATIESRVWAAYANQTPRRVLAKQIVEDIKVSRRRADLIARDQTTKLAASLDEMRSIEAGLDAYEWRHSGKAHPRLNHLARNGKRFLFSHPPEDGGPGKPINCGCRALPIVEFED